MHSAIPNDEAMYGTLPIVFICENNDCVQVQYGILWVLAPPRALPISSTLRSLAFVPTFLTDVQVRTILRVPALSVPYT